jgi:hypothetical protein
MARGHSEPHDKVEHHGCSDQSCDMPKPLTTWSRTRLTSRQLLIQVKAALVVCMIWDYTVLDM